jgi:hypothetical protein
MAEWREGVIVSMAAKPCQLEEKCNQWHLKKAIKYLYPEAVTSLKVVMQNE